MADDDHSGTKPAPVVLRIKLRYDDVETFVDRFAANVGRAGLFVHSKTPRPVGTEVKFELRLANDQPILVGIGAVRESRVPDPERPRAPAGMMIGFTRVTRDSRDLLLRVLEYRKLHDLPDGPGGMPWIGERDASVVAPLPRPHDRDSGVVVSVPTFESQPVAAPLPIPVPVPAAAAAGAGASERMAAATSSLAAASAAAIEIPPPPPASPLPIPLAPEPARRSRPRPHELIAAATGAMQTTTAAVDDTVDIARVLARARAIVTGDDLDAELAALGGPGGPDATPAPVSADEASNRLASMLGVAVRRSVGARTDRAASERAFAERTAEAGRAAAAAAAERTRTDEIAADRAAESKRSADERNASEQSEALRITTERAARRAQAERLAAERAATAERAAAEHAEAERVAVAARAEAERVAADREASARANAERAVVARIEAAGRAEAERIAAAAAARADAEHAAAERETERLAGEREAQRIAADRDAAKKLVAERAEAMRQAAERAELERAAAVAREAERSAVAREAERLAAEREAIRVAAVRAEADRAEAERAEADRAEAERAAEHHVTDPFRRASSPILEVDDESTAMTDEPPLPPELDIVAPDAAVTLPATRRPITPTPIDDDPGSELAASLANRGPVTALGIVAEPVAPAFVPDKFEDDPDTAYQSEIPGRAKRWMPRLESDIEDAIESALFEVGADDAAPPRPPPPREGTLDVGFDILDEADAADVAEVADAATPIEAELAPIEPSAPFERIEAPLQLDDPDNEVSNVAAIPSAIPSESAYRPSSPDDFEDDEEPIRAAPSRAAPSRAAPGRRAGAYSISRARSDDGTVDYERRGEALDPEPGRHGSEALDPDDAALTLDGELAPPAREPRVPQDFRHFDERYDATPEPIDDFAERLSLDSRSVSLAGVGDPSDFNDLAERRRDESDLYINADDLRAGARDADDLYGAAPRAGSAAPETDDDLGDIADPPAPESYPEFDGEEASAPYMDAAAPSPEEVYDREPSQRYRAFSPPGDWDRSDVHDAAPEVPPAAAQELAPIELAADDIDLDLQAALEELDPDLGHDDQQAAAPAPRAPKPRAVTDDGILIDFDDDE